MTTSHGGMEIDMEETRHVRKRDIYKRIITFSEGVLLLAAEVLLFARMWYTEYADNTQAIQIPFWNKGNWAVIGMYAIIISTAVRQITHGQIDFIMRSAGTPVAVDVV